MEFHLGFVELLAFAGALSTAVWALLKFSLEKFSKGLDVKFALLDNAVNEIKRLELEIVRNDAKNAQVYSTKADNDKVLNRIFLVLERMEQSQHDKITRDEAEKLVRNAVQFGCPSNKS